MDQEFRHMCELLAMDDQSVCSHRGMKFDPPAEGEPFCSYECQEAAREVELEILQKDRARLDWLLLGLDIVRIGSSEHLRDLALSACDLAGDWSNAAFVANYLEVCREAIDAAMKKEE